MTNAFPLFEDEFFDKVSRQGKTIAVGDKVVVNHAGQRREAVVTSISRKQGHYWVGYDENQHVCPWPLVQPANGRDND